MYSMKEPSSIVQRIAAVIGISLLTVGAISTQALAKLHVPLQVSDSENIQRIDEPVTSGVPLPQSAQISSTGELWLADGNGNSVPAQFEVLSRWNGTPHDESKPIKWVLVDFQADVPGQGTSVYYLNDGNENTSGSPGNISIEDSEKHITINTGKARFQISKQHFNLFDYVWIDRDKDGSIDDAVVSSPDQGGLVLKGANGTVYSTIAEPPEEITLENQGSMHAVVNIRGVFKADDGSYFAPSICKTEDFPEFCQPYPKSYFYYNCRIHFYSGKSSARVFLTLENNGANGYSNPEKYFAPVQEVHFEGVNLQLNTIGLSSPQAMTDQAATTLSEANDQFTIIQDWREDLADDIASTKEPLFAEGPFFEMTKNSNILTSGKTTPGWVNLQDGSNSVFFAMRDFWQNYPKRVTASSSGLNIGLWPEGGYYPHTEEAKTAGTYLFDGGRHKTFEMLFNFQASNTHGNHLAAALNAPLMALAPPEWYAQSKALGLIAPDNMEFGDQEVNEAYQRYEQHQKAMVDSSFSENQWTIKNIKTSENPHWEFPKQNNFFGWMHYGDLLWSGQIPCALHYDWTYSMLLHYIRTGKREFFAHGATMAKHRYDVDQYHGERSGNEKWLNYMQFYESEGHADPSVKSYMPSRVSPPSHTWNGGIVLYYLLTGDYKAWEAARENGRAALNYYGKNGLHSAEEKACAEDETRMETWSLLNLLNLYRVKGKQEHLNVAINIAKNRMLTREQAAGGNGNFGNGECNEDFTGQEQESLMYAYAIEPLVNIAYETKSKELEDLIVRMADWSWNKLFFGGDYNAENEYRPLQCCFIWTADDPDGSKRRESLDPSDPGYYRERNFASGEPIKSSFWSDLYAYAYQITGSSKYLNWADHTFKDAMFYFTSSGNNYINPEMRSTISFIDGGFPNSHTKVHGWLTRTNQIYLNLRWQLLNSGLRIITTTLPDGLENSSYSYQLTATGGEPGYSFTPKDSLPAGLSLSSAGIISGIPEMPGSFSFTIQVSDSADGFAEKSFTLNIAGSTAEKLGGPTNLQVAD